MGKVNRTVRPDGSISYRGGSFTEMVDTAVTDLIERNGGIEAVKAIMDSIDVEAVKARGFVCGQAQILANIYGEG
jgi:hypothetical protein